MTAYGQRIGAAARGFGQQLPLKETATTLGTTMGDNAPSIIMEGQKCRHLESIHGGGAMLPFDRECAETLALGHGGGVMQTDDRGIDSMRYIVRRLTPTECERLMGLPDGHTIPQMEVTDALVDEFVNVWAEWKRITAPGSKPKTAKQVRAWLEKVTRAETCPDAPRYKACGNGWATNQPRWILFRLLDHIDPDWMDGEDA